MSFQFRMGTVYSYHPWMRPTLDSFGRWWNKVKEYPKAKDYNIILSGAFSEKIWGHYEGDTWDIDVIIQNFPHSPFHMRDFLTHMIQTGLDMGILIDAFHQNPLFDGVNFTPFVKYRISDGWYKVRNSEVLEWKFEGDQITEIIPGLWEFVYTEPPPSWQKYTYRMLNYQYKGIKIDLWKDFRWV